MKSKELEKNVLIEKILNKEAVIGVIGMGYIGLSLLEVFGKAGYSLVGYDLSESKVERLKQKKEIYNYFSMNFLYGLMDKGKFHPSDDTSILKKADVILISVATSIDLHHIPDLKNLYSAFKTAASALKKDQLIVLQSSTYPGTTEEELLPVLEASGLKVGKDFYLANVPEIVDIGNPEYVFANIPRIVSGITPDCLEVVKLLYEQIGCEVVPCPTTQVAESAKMLQNCYRMVNISFINEMKIMFHRMGIDVWDVIAAASTKPFGFTPFYPSAGAGGDCIPTDPFYLIWKANVTDGPTSLLEIAGKINDSMPNYVLNKTIEHLAKSIQEAKILVLGVGFKKDVNDIRHSSGLKILQLLQKVGAKQIDYQDPYASEIKNVPEFPGLELKSIKLDYAKLMDYDAVIIISEHSVYDWDKIVANSKLVVDTRNATAKVPGPKKNVIKA